ncbi:MAG TPA: hypothetical protein VMM76_01010 [Pirellulaceae bacterium]|nr:hypothetical protein [Pirellulaceae bacterium]
MRVIIFCCVIAAPMGMVGCDRPQNVKSATPQQNSLPKTTTNTPRRQAERTEDLDQQNSLPTTTTNTAQLKAPAGEVHDGITVADLMQTLGMRIFKTRINEPGLPTVKRVALCVKSPESQPITVVSIEIEDAATPGTLLVFLQEGRWEGYRYIGGIVYKGDNGRTSETSGLIRENPFEKVVGTRSGVGITNRPGLAIIECSGTFRGNDELETTPDAAGIYVKVE